MYNVLINFHTLPLTTEYAMFHGNAGYECERKKAHDRLEVGKSYKVVDRTEYAYVSYVTLEGVEGKWNSALFHCDSDTLPPTYLKDLYILPHDGAMHHYL